MSFSWTMKAVDKAGDEVVARSCGRFDEFAVSVRLSNNKELRFENQTEADKFCSELGVLEWQLVHSNRSFPPPGLLPIRHPNAPTTEVLKTLAKRFSNGETLKLLANEIDVHPYMLRVWIVSAFPAMAKCFQSEF